MTRRTDRGTRTSGRWRRRGERGEHGMATVELAMVLPALVAVTAGLVWLLAVGAAQVRVVDAARETARAAARGDDDGAAVARGERVAPPGSTIALTRSGGEVVVEASGEVDGPGGLFTFLPAVTVHATAAALDEVGPVTPRSPRSARPRGRPATRRRRGEAGSVTLFAVGCLALLLLVGAALGVVAAMVRAHRMAQSAADLAALAGAASVGPAGAGDPCTAAGTVAERNGATLLACTVAGREVRVSTEVPGPRWLGQVADLTGEARAGPG